MTRPVAGTKIKLRSAGACPPRGQAALFTELAARLTARDRNILELVAEHRVLTTNQIAAIFFPSEVKARHRLLALHRLSALDRFRPWTPSGSAPWHWVTGPGGGAVLAAARGLTLAEDGYRRDNALAICHSAKLAHQLGVNEFFTQLHACARRERGAVEAWWSERRCARLWGDLAQPDAYGRWTCGGAEVDFFVEHDTGSEPAHRVAAKLAAYANLAEATGITTPVLFWLPSARREQNLRKLIGDPEVPAATAVHTSPGTGGPAGRVWLPTGSSGQRERLIDLARTWPATSVQPRRHLQRASGEEEPRRAGSGHLVDSGTP